MKSMQTLLLLSVLLTTALSHQSGAHHFGAPKQYTPHPSSIDREALTADDLPVLNIHIIAHTHDDVGWLKTVDQYYMGSNQSIQDAGVQYIIDGVIDGLLANPERKFMYVEIAFFSRWWREQSESMKKNVKTLVAEGRLEFINGGWCMNDEATTHFTAVIDQMTLGHQFLQDEFGVRPTIGWHVDPFGHSAMQASMFSQMGFDAFFFGRIDYSEHDYRNKTSELEFIWRGSENFGSETEIWSHVLYTDYCYLHGYNWESGDDPIQDDPRLYDENVREKADQFAAQLRQRAASNKHNNVLVPFGCDFQFEKAPINFKNMDKLISYFKKNGQYKLNLMYSTPSIYTKYVNSADITWSVKTSDFFPYADGPHAFWTGYFTSRANLKGYEKQINSLSHAVDKLVSTRGLLKTQLSTTLEALSTLDDAYGIVQHHDAVAGTEKQHVAFDYAKRLSVGQDAAESFISQALDAIINNNSGVDQSKSGAFSFCRLLNESICPHTEDLSQPIAMVLYNQLSSVSEWYLTVPVTTRNVVVTDEQNNIVSSSTQPNNKFPNKYDLTFKVKVAAFGHNTYFLQKGAPQKQRKSRENSIENSIYRLVFNPQTGRLTGILNKKDKLQVTLTQDYMWYNSSKGTKDDGQSSGAYIFRPAGLYPVNTNKIVNQITTGDIRSEVKQVWGPWLSQTIRLTEGSPFIQIETTITPINISDNLGKEVIVSYATDFITSSTWYSDSQGLEMIPRVIGKRPYWPSFPFNITEPESFNYVPMNEAAYIRDVSDRRLTFVTDRSRGCASQSDGQFEMMLQRRILNDDGRGVAEALNETITLTTHHWIAFTKNDEGSHLQRMGGQGVNNPFVIAFRPVTGSIPAWSAGKTLSGSALKTELPANVQLTNLKTLPNGDVIIRLHHIFSYDESQQYSQPVTVDMFSIFNTFTINSVREVILTGTTEIGSINKLKWKTSTQSASKFKFAPLEGTKVTLRPMEIRTFVLSVSNI